MINFLKKLFTASKKQQPITKESINNLIARIENETSEEFTSIKPTTEIQTKTFSSLVALNDFTERKDVEFISMQSIMEKVSIPFYCPEHLLQKEEKFKVFFKSKPQLV